MSSCVPPCVPLRACAPARVVCAPPGGFCVRCCCVAPSHRLRVARVFADFEALCDKFDFSMGEEHSKRWGKITVKRKVKEMVMKKVKKDVEE